MSVSGQDDFALIPEGIGAVCVAFDHAHGIGRIFEIDRKEELEAGAQLLRRLVHQFNTGFVIDFGIVPGAHIQHETVNPRRLRFANFLLIRIEIFSVSGETNHVMRKHQVRGRGSRGAGKGQRQTQHAETPP